MSVETAALVAIAVCFLLLYQRFYALIKQKQNLSQALNVEKDETKRKVQYLAKVSHDLRTPLHGINGLIDVLERETVAPKSLHYIDQMRVTSQGLMNVINDVIDLAKTTEDKGDLKIDTFRLVDVCENTVRIFSAAADAKNIELSLHMDPRLFDYQVVSSSQKLYKIFSNLIGNAFKFTDYGSVALWVVYKTEQEHQVDVRFIVADTGIGISKQDIARIFDPFKQVESEQHARVSGSGLGLDICRESVEQLGGVLKVTSQKNLGSKFYFDLTLKKTNLQVTTNLTSGRLGPNDVVLISLKTTVTESIIQLLTSWHIGVKHYDSIETASENSDDGAIARLLLVDFNVADSFSSIKCLAAHFQATATAIMINSNQYREFHEFQVIYKPILPSELLKLCVRVDLVKHVYTLSNLQIDYTNMVIDFAEVHNITMLIVDDLEINRMILHELLKSLGFENFDFAENGQQAIELQTKNTYSLIWMDLHMPVMSGDEASKHIRDNAVSNTKIVALTASIDEDVISKCRAYCDLILSKPITREKVAEHIFSMFIAHQLTTSDEAIVSQNLLSVIAHHQSNLPISILAVADNSGLKTTILQTFAFNSDYRVSFLKEYAEFLPAVQAESFNLVIIEQPKGMSMLENVLASMHEKRISIPVLLVCTNADERNINRVSFYRGDIQSVTKREFTPVILSAKVVDMLQKKNNAIRITHTSQDNIDNHV